MGYRPLRRNLNDMFWLIITVAAGCAVIGAIIGGTVLLALSRVPGVILSRQRNRVDAGGKNQLPGLLLVEADQAPWRVSLDSPRSRLGYKDSYSPMRK